MDSKKILVFYSLRRPMQTTMSSSPGSTNADACDDSVQESEGENRSLLASSYYAKNSNQLKVLIPMTIGLKDNSGNPLFDEDKSPWSSGQIKVKEWKPANDHLNEEVKR